MLSFDLIDMELIAILSQELSLSAAAQRIGISASAVSQRLTRMENLAGHKLVHRPGPMRLTKAGERLLKAALAIKREYRALEDDLSALYAGGGSIRIMANASLMIDDLPTVLEGLRGIRPDLHIELAEGSIQEITKSVLDGATDAGLLVGKQNVDGLRFIPYKRDRICIIAPLSHPIAQHRAVSFKDAAAHSFIGVDSTKPITAIISGAERKERLHINYAMHVTSSELQAHMVAETTIGIALAPESIARRFAATHPIRLVQLLDDWASGEFVICVSDIGTMSPACMDFVRLLRQKFIKTT